MPSAIQITNTTFQLEALGLVDCGKLHHLIIALRSTVFTFRFFHSLTSAS